MLKQRPNRQENLLDLQKNLIHQANPAPQRKVQLMEAALKKVLMELLMIAIIHKIIIHIIATIITLIATIEVMVASFEGAFSSAEETDFSIDLSILDLWPAL